MFFACTVCKEVLTSICNISSIHCGHVFHTNCLTKWINAQGSCPQCRSACTYKQLNRIYLSESTKENVIADALQIAAKNGLPEIYQRIAQGEEEKNPQDCFGVTNLHIAAKNGHSKVCKLIMDMVEDKNPKDHAGINPLTLSLIHNQENVCIEVLKNFNYKNPTF